MAATIQVSSTDISLFHVAARLYGDATAWLAIADANALTDPVIIGLGTITTPDYASSLSGGAPQQ